MCADFALIVLDAVSDARPALDLKFARDNDDWGVPRKRLSGPMSRCSSLYQALANA